MGQGTRVGVVEAPTKLFIIPVMIIQSFKTFITGTHTVHTKPVALVSTD